MSSFFIQQNAFETVVWKMVAILSPPLCVKKLLTRKLHFSSNCMKWTVKICILIYWCASHTNTDKWKPVLISNIRDIYYWAHILSLTQNNLRLCSANHRPGYFSNLACDWLSIVWAYSEQETRYEKWVNTATFTSFNIKMSKQCRNSHCKIHGLRTVLSLWWES